MADSVAQPVHVVIVVDDGGQMAIRIDDACLLINSVLLYEVGVTLEARYL